MAPPTMMPRTRWSRATATPTTYMTRAAAWVVSPGSSWTLAIHTMFPTTIMTATTTSPAATSQPSPTSPMRQPRTVMRAKVRRPATVGAVHSRWNPTRSPSPVATASF